MRRFTTIEILATITIVELIATKQAAVSLALWFFYGIYRIMKDE